MRAWVLSQHSQTSKAREPGANAHSRAHPWPNKALAPAGALEKPPEDGTLYRKPAPEVWVCICARPTAHTQPQLSPGPCPPWPWVGTDTLLLLGQRLSCSAAQVRGSHHLSLAEGRAVPAQGAAQPCHPANAAAVTQAPFRQLQKDVRSLRMKAKWQMLLRDGPDTLLPQHTRQTLQRHIFSVYQSHTCKLRALRS